MNTDQAIELIKKVCALYKGNLNEHMAIQQAIKIVEDNIKEVK